MIVRNEKDNIGPALDTILPLADEIIINVNSSDDGTHEIVKEYAKRTGKIKHLSCEWHDDFSLARNQVLNEAKHPWIIWLDADDRVPKESIEDIKLLGDAPTDRAFQFNIINGRVDGISFGPEFYQTRMFPNDPDLRWEHRVHEQISPSIEKKGLPRIPVAVKIYHLGYNNPELKKTKARRNLRLMEMDPLVYPIDYTHRAHAYDILEEHKSALEWYLKAYNLPDVQNQNPDLYFSLPSDIGGQYMKMKDYETAIKWFLKCDENNIEGAYQLACCYEELEKYHVAVNMYYRVLKLNKPGALTVAIEYDACRIYAFHFLLRLLIVMKRHSDAVKLIADMTRQYPGIACDRR